MGSPEHLTAATARQPVPGVPDLPDAPDAGGRTGPLLRTAAVAWLLVLGCLALWSLAPLVLGWQPSVVVTGSMLPTVRPGDVLVVEPGTDGVRRGAIVLATDPSMPSGRVAHRVVEVRADGTFVTKGDANPTADVHPRRRSDVVGTVRLVVPSAGRLALLRHTPSRGDLVWAGLAVAACLVLGATRPAHER